MNGDFISHVTPILGEKKVALGQKEPFSPPKKRGNGRNAMKYMSFIIVNHRESHSSHNST